MKLIAEISKKVMIQSIQQHILFIFSQLLLIIPYQTQHFQYSNSIFHLFPLPLTISAFFHQGLQCFITESSIQQMEIEPNLYQVDFQVALNSFHDELLSKLEYFNTVEIELLRKFECNINLPETHSELVFYLRNMIQMIEEAFKDVESYFQDLRMTYLYDYFRKIQVLMINGFNFLSQALLIQIDTNEKEREYKVKAKEIDRIVIRQKAEPVKNLKEQAKEMEHYDYAINYYQNQQAKIAEEMHRIQDNIIMSKGLVEKLHPSKAVKELQEIKERAEITLENTEKIFEETYQLKYLEFKQYLSKLQRPEDITKDFCDNLKLTMLDKFQTGMKRSVNLLYSMKKEDELAKLVENGVQTEELEPAVKLQKKATTVAAKNGQKLQNLLIRQRKLTQKLLGELQLVKKDIETLQTEKFRLQGEGRQTQCKLKELTYNYDILSKIYEQKREEFGSLRKAVEEKDFVIDKLRVYEMMCIRDAAGTEEGVQTEELKQFSDAEVQANMQDNEIIVILKKTNEKMGERIRQKQIRIKQIEKKQITDKKQKLSRLRISQTISPEIVANLAKKLDELRSSASSDNSLSSSTVKQEKQRTSFVNLGDKTTKDYSKLLVRPSNFAIKRFSNKDIITISEKERRTSRRQSQRRTSTIKINEVSVQANFTVTQQKLLVSRQTQYDLLVEHQILRERKIEVTRPQQERERRNHEQKTQQYALPEPPSQRKNEKRSFKKILPASREKKLRKQISVESNRQDVSFSNRYDRPDPFPEGEERVEAERQHEQVTYFENLNLQTEECRQALQKRSALSKKFLCNVRKREKSNELDQKNKTCIGQFYKPRRFDDSLETKHLICIDRIDLAKKQSKRYEKMSVNSKPSQKFIKPLNKQNCDKSLLFKLT